MTSHADANSGSPDLDWDNDQFPMNIRACTSNESGFVTGILFHPEISLFFASIGLQIHNRLATLEEC